MRHRHLFLFVYFNVKNQQTKPPTNISENNKKNKYVQLNSTKQNVTHYVQPKMKRSTPLSALFHSECGL